jgi:hypothetical protein
MEEQITKWVVFKTILIIGVVICTLGVGILYTYKYFKTHKKITLANGTKETYKKVSE